MSNVLQTSVLRPATDPKCPTYICVTTVPICPPAVHRPTPSFHPDPQAAPPPPLPGWPRLAQVGPGRPDWPRLARLAKAGPGWPRLARMAQAGPLVSGAVGGGTDWGEMVPCVCCVLDRQSCWPGAAGSHACWSGTTVRGHRPMMLLVWRVNTAYAWCLAMRLVPT